MINFDSVSLVYWESVVRLSETATNWELVGLAAKPAPVDLAVSSVVNQ